MEVKILKEEEKDIAYIIGRVDTVTAPELEKILLPLWTNKTTLVFDCTDLEYISSAGLRVVLMAHKSLVSKGGKFILRNLNKEVRSVIDLTGFSRILTIE